MERETVEKEIKERKKDWLSLVEQPKSYADEISSLCMFWFSANMQRSGICKSEAKRVYMLFANKLQTKMGHFSGSNSDAEEMAISITVDSWNDYIRSRDENDNSRTD